MTTKTRRFNFTKAALEALPPAAAGGRDTYHDTKEPALAIRVTETGKKTFRVRGRPRGQLEVETLTIGPFPAVPIERARAKAKEQLTRWAAGESLAAEKRAEQQAARTSISFAEALAEYLKCKTRLKDGKALKQRTRDDYAQMVRPARAKGAGVRAMKAGELHRIASRALSSLTADDIRATHESLLAERGAHRAAYAMRVLRAVLGWHGVQVPDNPLGKEVAGRDRITLPKAPGNPTPIPAEKLGTWWRTAIAPPEGQAEPDEVSDYLCFLLLTGCRSGEAKETRRGEVIFSVGLTVGEVDLVAKQALLRDTKNRSDHTLHLSRQALEILRRRVKGKTPAAPVFNVGDVRARLDAINRAAGVDVSPHDLRATFVSIAEELVSVYALKRMVNHSDSGDVTGAHYVGKSEAQLRAGWQAVADFIDDLAAKAEDAQPAQIPATCAGV